MKPVSFKFDEKTVAMLDELQNESNASSKTEVIRRALYLFKFCLNANKNGDHLILKDKGGEQREIVFWH